MVVAILLTKRGTTTLEPTGSASADPPPFAKGRCYNDFRTHTDANNPAARFTQREMHDVTVIDAKLQIPPFAKGKYLLYNKSSFSGRSADGSAQRSGR